MGTARYVYNRAVSLLEEEEKHLGTIELTKRLVTQKGRDGSLNKNVPEWTFDTPKDIRKGALRDLEAAKKAAITNLKQGNIRAFKLGYKRKKELSSVEVPDSALEYKDGKLKIYKTYGLGNIKVSKRECKRKPIVIEHYCRLQFYRNQWFLCVPYTKRSKERSVPTKKCCALDPGVRTFQTVYSPEEVVKVQQNQELINKLHKQLDKFQALRDKRSIRGRSYRRRATRIYTKLDNCITALHYETIKYLKNFEQILLPSFETQEMVSKKGLHSSTKRRMLGLQHYRFKQRLIHSLELDSHSNVNIVCESYTSQTCSNCGLLTKPPGNTFACSSCQNVIDRDVNGARNILIKHLTHI